MIELVSVIIPCRNEEKYIAACISSVLNSNYDKNLLQIIVCDGMSDDNTRKIVSNYSNLETVELIDNLKKTTPHALNLGVSNSKGDIIIILGAHAEIDKNYIKFCLETLQKNPEIGCVGGILETISENNETEAIAIAMSSSFGVGNAHFRTGNQSGIVDTVAFGAYKRIVFEKSGLFDEELIRNQDDEFNFRIQKNGFKIYLNPEIKAKYFVRSSFSKLFKQYYQYGYWKVYVNKKHKTITTLRQIIPALFVLFLLSGPIINLIFPFYLLLYFGLIGMYFISAFYSAIKINKKNKIFKILFSFFILHFSYGFGYLRGIFDFYLRNKKPSSSLEKLTR